jgi:hypothetical protein
MNTSRTKFIRGTFLATTHSLLGHGLVAQEVLFEWTGDNRRWIAAYDSFGRSVSFAGDLDGDGVPDALVGAPKEDTTLGKELGAVYAFSGATGDKLYKLIGDENRSLFSIPTSGGSDFDGDGVGDFVAGAGLYDTSVGVAAGAAFAYSGATGTLLWSNYGERSSDIFGGNVTTLGDVDGDGRGDFAVGATAYDVPPTIGQCGKVYVYSGASGSLIHSVTGTTTDENFSVVRRLGDVNGDGIGDLGVGAFGWGAGSNGQGRFDVLDGPTGALIYSLEGEDHGDTFGGNAGRLGDIDQDGVDDFIVAAPAHSINPGSGSDTEGRIYVYSGATGMLLYQYDGVSKNEQMSGVPNEGGIDLNGDGYPDIAIGSALRPVAALDRGIVSVYSGRTGRLLFDFKESGGVYFSGGLGGSLSLAGDMNGDGIDDLIVGAPSTNKDGYPSAGKVWVFAGNDLFLQANEYEYGAGDPIELAIRGGTPALLGLITLVEINGAGTFLPVLVGPLDINGELILSSTVPSGLSGLTLKFMGYAQKSLAGGIVDSIPETMTFK